MSSFSYFVGQRIKKYRKSRGYTIEQFSAIVVLEGTAFETILTPFNKFAFEQINFIV